MICIMKNNYTEILMYKSGHFLEEQKSVNEYFILFACKLLSKELVLD